VAQVIDERGELCFGTWIRVRRDLKSQLLVRWFEAFAMIRPMSATSWYRSPIARRSEIAA